MIAEKVADSRSSTFLNQRIFGPLGMHPLDQDNTNTPAFPAGYHRFALGPVRVAQPPARGWLYAAGELSMTAADLAKWDIARMNRSLIPARDWAEQETPVLRTDGRTNGYGLGVYNTMRASGTSSITAEKRSASSRRTRSIPTRGTRSSSSPMRISPARPER